MTQPARVQEPSMEEILASIRRIIADDDAAKSPPPKAPEPAKPAPADPAPRAPLSATPPKPEVPPVRQAPPEVKATNSQDDIDALFSTPEPAEAPSAAEQGESDILELTEAMQAEAPAFRRIDGGPDVVYNESAPSEPAMVEQARRSFQQHTEADRSLLAPSTTAAVDAAFNSLAQTVLVQNSRTLDDLVREMLRPMLKAWLDDNLPNMVERLVRAEIERVSRGRG
jgi:cell pole-organizing protein PopZ